MNTVDTGAVKRNKDGKWVAEQEIKLFDNRVLRISTYKMPNGTIVTRAVSGLRDEHSFVVVYGFSSDGDFMETLQSIRGVATEKSIATAHANAISGAGGLSFICDRAKAYYSRLEANTAAQAIAA